MKGTPRNLSDGLIIAKGIWRLAFVQTLYGRERRSKAAEHRTIQAAETRTSLILMLLAVIQIAAIWHPWTRHAVFQQ
jgi:hypothetical protein